LRRAILVTSRPGRSNNASIRFFSSASAKPAGTVNKPMFSRTVSLALAVGGVAIFLAAASTGKSTASESASAHGESKELAMIIQQLSEVTSRLEAIEKSFAAGREKKTSEASTGAPKAGAGKAKEEIIAAATATNRAFIFIKPHANTDKVDTLVKECLASSGLKIKEEGKLKAEDIDSRKLIDTHYGAIASKAVLVKPAQLNVPQKGKDQFKETFGMTWEDAVGKGLVLNAADACAKLKVDGDELESLWRKIDKKGLIKFGGGFYCGQLSPEMYVINGFYMQMRGNYTKPPASIKYYEVEWSPAAMSWKNFRENFLGATDPTKAASSSLRRKIYDNWQSLGLTAQPDTGNNGMHGSASPFEALAEVANWEGKSIENDAFGQGLLAASGLDVDTLKIWLADAQVPVNGKPTSIFDTLEDQDSKGNIETICEIVSKLPAKVVQ